MTTQQSNTKLTMPIKDTIILDSKKCNAELLTIHADGRITVAEHLKPTETAAKVLQIMREQWMDSIQSKKIREQDDRIKRLEEDLMGAKNKHAALVADVALYEDRAERIKRLEDIISRAAYAFYRDGSDGQVASGMLTILEEVRKP